MAVLLQLRIELAVQLVNLLPRLLVLDELADQKVRALPDLLVEPGPRYPVPHLLERSRPRLGVQVVGVHQRPVYVEHHDLRHLRPSQLQYHPDTGEAVYTRSADRSVSEEYAALRVGDALVAHFYTQALRLAR